MEVRAPSLLQLWVSKKTTHKEDGWHVLCFPYSWAIVGNSVKLTWRRTLLVVLQLSISRQPPQRWHVLCLLTQKHCPNKHHFLIWLTSNRWGDEKPFQGFLLLKGSCCGNLVWVRFGPFYSISC